MPRSGFLFSPLAKEFIPSLIARALLLGTAFLSILALASPSQAQRLAIRNARIIPVQGAVIENGTLLIENGKIKALGANIAIPAGTTIVDGTGKVLVPGLVDANAHYGLRETPNEQSNEVTPQIRVLPMVNPRSSEFKRALQSGVTSVCLTPGSLNVVGGLCAVVKTTGNELDRILVRDAVAERGALGQDTFGSNSGFLNAGGDLSTLYLRRPNSRMGAVWEMRHALDQPKKYPALALVRAGNLPMRIQARIENDIRAALTIAQEFKIPHVVIDDCTEGFRVVDLLAERHVSVVLGPFNDPQGFSPERSESSLSTAALLSSKGVPVAFGSNDGDATQLLAWAVLAVRNGMSPDAALKAITSTAAEVAGVGDRVGSLAPGKDADILILSGDPLELTTHIERVLVNGQVVYRAE
ncbi:MAG: amidohydrolase [Chthonomonadales bacterium]|nr:amidohydrolase [Chthonomonadales bacterium]